MHSGQSGNLQGKSQHPGAQLGIDNQFQTSSANVQMPQAQSSNVQMPMLTNQTQSPNVQMPMPTNQAQSPNVQMPTSTNQAQSKNIQQAQSGNQTTDRNLIGVKELDYLKDFMSWELLAMKKCNEAAQGVMDPQIARTIRDMGWRHQQHYTAILNHLH
jgi:hypothetical protein